MRSARGAGHSSQPSERPLRHASRVRRPHARQALRDRSDNGFRPDRAEEQYDRRFQRHGEPERPVGKRRGNTQERTERVFSLPKGRSPKYTDDLPALEAFLDAQHRFGTPGAITRVFQFRRQPVEPRLIFCVAPSYITMLIG